MEINELWTYNHSEPILTLEMGDINADGRNEVIATTGKGKILVFSSEGNLILEEIISDNQPLWHSLLVDIDDDRKAELVIGGLDGILRVYKYVNSNKLTLIWNHKFNSSISGLLTKNTGANKLKELISYSLDKTIRVLNPLDGTMRWGQVFEDGIGDVIFWTDSNDPKHREVIACGNDGTVRSFNEKNGELQWFIRYKHKMRCISSLNSKKGQIFAIGGDDKILHLVRIADQEEIKSMEFEDYIWKLHSFPKDNNDKIILSTYSFDYLNDSLSLDDITFTSKIVCIDKNLEILWEIDKFNAESLEIFEFKKHPYILIGTTKGNVLMVDGNTGSILVDIKKSACTNMVKYFFEKHSIFSCHDDGSLYCFKLNYL